MYKRIISWFLVILWMAVIYSFSAESGETSGGKSQKITKSIQFIIDKTPLKGKVQWTDFATRKTGHVSEYLILTLLVYNALTQSGFKKRNRILLALLVPLVYASLDEFHQSFIAGRGPSVRDVLIDGIGILLGAGMSSIRKR